MYKLLVSVYVLTLSLSTFTHAATYGGGSGTELDPYQIWTPEQMNTIGLNPDDWDKHFKLMADIDMSIYTGTQYNIIGTDYPQRAFTGTFDGDGHVIRNLTYTTSSSVFYVGVFGCTHEAVIQNLGVENVSISSNGDFTGGLVGLNGYKSTIISCHVTGSVVGYSNVGAVVGSNSSYASLISCYATGSVYGFVNIGGLSGGNNCFGSISYCYSNTSILWMGSSTNIGGLVGWNYGLINSCYATGPVGGNSNIGGLVGENDFGSITSCYSTGSVSGNFYVGGLVGVNNAGSTTACFWDIQTSGQMTSAGGSGKTTVEMMTALTFNNANWDFENTWSICEGTNFPRLQWQILSADLTCPNGVNIEDLYHYFSQWLREDCTLNNDYCGKADMDISGIVDLADFSKLSDQWMVGIKILPDDMVYIPGGMFQMGNNFVNEGEGNEVPVHSVNLNSFNMGKYEVTNSQFCDFLNSAKSRGLIIVLNNVVFQAGPKYHGPIYCYTYHHSSACQIYYSGSVFSVNNKSGRSMVNDPIVHVTWYGAIAYCNWRSEQEGRQPCYDLTTCTCDFTKNGYRLPTEAEWEYAARGGLSRKRFPWGNTISHNMANYYSFWNGGVPKYPYDVSSTEGLHPLWNDGVAPYTSPVGFFDGGLKYKTSYNWPSSLTSYHTTSGANGYGLYDMAGNVAELCNDWLGDYSSNSQTNPTGPTTGLYRVARGGSSGGSGTGCRVSARISDYGPGSHSEGLGFRIAMNNY